jgi:hypothetical protein
MNNTTLYCKTTATPKDIINGFISHFAINHRRVLDLTSLILSKSIRSSRKGSNLLDLACSLAIRDGIRLGLMLIIKRPMFPEKYHQILPFIKTITPCHSQLTFPLKMMCFISHSIIHTHTRGCSNSSIKSLRAFHQCKYKMMKAC